MAWFANYYTCGRCKKSWTDEWSCTCDDDCPHCGARHMSPSKSDDLTEIISQEHGSFVAYRSPDSAEHCPDYRELGRFKSRAAAQNFLNQTS
jgi:hypothetical protein